MKMLIICFMTFILTVNCQAQIEIGKPIKNYTILNSDSSFYILTSPSDIEKAYEILFDSVFYRVTLSKNRYIEFIETLDTNFKTLEGLCIGKKFSDIDKGEMCSKIFDYKGWGKFVKLCSGWYAVFHFEKPLKAASPIQFFFKKNL